MAIDYGYEVNKRNSTEQSIKTEMVGGFAGSATSTIVEGISWKFPTFNGISKMLTNTVISDNASDKAKKIYEQKEKK